MKRMLTVGMTVSLLLAVAGALVAPVMADPTLKAVGYYYGDEWGDYYLVEYAVQTWGIPGHGDAVEWRTFCLELGDIVQFGETYDAVVNKKTIGYGQGTDGDPLDFPTAWLFTQYVEGNTVADINLGSMNDDLAVDLQLAIWWLEDEIASEDWQSLTNNAKAFVGAAEVCNWTDLADIRVLNLYVEDSDHGQPANYRQDMLVQIPVPGAVVLGAVGLCLVGIGGWAVKRRLA